MTRYLTLLIAAYGLLAIETALQTETGLVTPFGSFVWMLLPWLATLPSPSTSILAAAGYGLMIDAVSNHQPGLLIAVTIVAVSILQRLITPKALGSSQRVFLTSLACGCLMAMLVATVSMLMGSSPVVSSVLVSSIIISSVTAALFTTFVATLARACGTVLAINQSATH
jgi:hypothetical protein